MVGRTKKYTNKSSIGPIIADEMHPYTFFIETPLGAEPEPGTSLLWWS